MNFKRGFLLDKPKKNAEIKRAPQAATTVPIVKIPSYTFDPPPPPAILPDTQRIPGSRDAQMNLWIASIPMPNERFPPEPYSICILWDKQKDAMYSRPGFPSRLISPPRNVYEIRPSPIAGLGMFATEDIANVVQMAIDKLPPWSKEKFFSLADSQSSRPSLLGIINTNAIPLGALPGFSGMVGGVCLELSRINHSCCPNVTHRFDLQSFSVEARAIRPIARGTELFIPYVHILDSRAERQKDLRSKYGFTCTCPSCSLPTAEERKRSDTVRGLLQNAAKMERVRALFDYEENAIDDNVWPVYLQRLVKAYCALGDEENAKTYAQRTAKLTLAFRGSDEGWDAVANNPKNTDWWGLRAKADAR
ncbi:SET domain-containing protein [Panus rudis PR-1116 ss-1]|nr:SET domain-containing protein [Panus rudis PR-1116 ss-1]